MPEAPRPTPETAALADVMVDPCNRFYRYRAAQWLLPLFRNTRVTPNQITYFHMVLGVAAAGFVASGRTWGLFVAFVLSELREVFDCFDGVLARAKRMSSPYGRTLDALGDALAYLAMCAAIYIHVRARYPEYPIGAAMLCMMATGGLMAWVTDLYKRKFAAALKTGSDDVFEQLQAKLQKIQAGEGGFVTRFGFWFDWMQVVILASSTRRELEVRLGLVPPSSPDEISRAEARSRAEVQYILAGSQSKGFRAALRSVSFMSGDNVFALINLGLLSGALVATQAVVMVYGLFTMALGIVLCNSFLQGSRRFDPSQDPPELVSAHRKVP